jgi:probable F420-dependent oxidoreductase
MNDLGRVGIWSGQLRRSDPGEISDAAAELDELGFGALWIPGGMGGDVFADSERLLTATKRAVVATGILNIWMHTPEDTARGHAAITSDHPGRFLLGLGVSHAVAVDASNQTYAKPLAKMVAYLDALDAATPPVPPPERALAALGPRMLELSRDRTAGAHPYFSTPEHTAVARDILGAGPLLAPEQMVVLQTDPESARAVARRHVRRYLQLPNYTNNLLRHGFDLNDLANDGSDRLVDAVVAWGDVGAIGRRVKEHHDAGADHVCIQVLRDDPAVLPREEWRELAALVKS